MAHTQRLWSHLVDIVAGRPELSVEQRQLAVLLSASVVDMVRDLDLPHRGQAAASAVQLLLSESVPELDPEPRDELARLCAFAVVRGL